jgi:hypothetical protein
MFDFMTFLKWILIICMLIGTGGLIVNGLLLLSKERRDKRREKGMRPLLELLILLVSGIAMGWLTFNWAFHNKYRAIRPFVANYAGLRLTAPDPLFDSDSMGYVRGKVIILDKVAGQDKVIGFESAPSGVTSSYTIVDSTISVLQKKLPDELSAEQPEDVGTVVWLIWDQKTIYYYTGDAKAYQVLCTVEIYDNQEKKLIQSKVFEGELPPKEGVTSRSFNGRPPSRDIIEYICSRHRIGMTDSSPLSVLKTKR